MLAEMGMPRHQQRDNRSVLQGAQVPLKKVSVLKCERGPVLSGILMSSRLIYTNTPYNQIPKLIRSITALLVVTCN